jgi:hypothetical protein
MFILFCFGDNNDMTMTQAGSDKYHDHDMGNPTIVKNVFLNLK